MPSDSDPPAPALPHPPKMMVAALKRPPPQTLPPPGAWKPAMQAAKAIVRPLEKFLSIQAASGIVLLAMAVIAMVWANSSAHESYHHLWHTPLSIGLGDFVFEQSLHFWINDGLMVIFFFVVGLEIRREMHHGELSELKRAALPIAAALGGMVVPALIYISLNSEETRHGWGVPMATDIAFAVGILTLLGKRVPAALRVLLLALAIIDDIGAILVIAVFYSSGVSLAGFGVAALGVALVLLMQRIGIRNPLAYIWPGLMIWVGIMQAGVHPTIAGVILGLLTPAKSWFGSEGFLEESREALQEVNDVVGREKFDSHDLIQPLERIDQAQREAIPPVVRIESMLNPWVAYFIMPLFALSNAGVTIDMDSLSGGATVSIALGVGLGLALGKPIGVVAFSLLATKLGLCSLPRGVRPSGLVVVGAVAGIGFTMALFIAQLAFSNATNLGVAKVAILGGSLVAGIVGVLVGLALLPKNAEQGVAISVDEAERSTAL